MNNINQAMRKVILTICLALVTVAMSAQEKGLHLTLSGTLAGTNLGYITNTDVKSQFNLGYGGTIGAQYFFTQNWGLSLGVGVTRYITTANYSNGYVFSDMYDNDPLSPGDWYDLHIELNDWTEIQKSLFLEIPLMAVYQKKWGKKEAFGMFFGIGAKLQLPFLQNKYEVLKGSELFVSGYYPTKDMTIDVLENRGFGKNDNTGYKGDFELKLGVAATAELGFLIKLNRRMDLTVSAYADYGFLNMKGKDKIEGAHLIGPEDNASTIHPENPNEKVSYIGERIQYNGFLNSSTVDKVNPLAIGGKLGIRVKIGKMKPTQEDDEEQQKEQKREDDSLARAEQKEFNNAIIDAIKDLQKGLNEILTWKDMVAERLAPTSKDGSSSPYANGNYPYGMSESEYRVIADGPVYFNLNSATIRDDQKEMLERHIAVMKNYPELQVRVAGNTCDLGSASLNTNLGLSRAKAVRAYMISKGIQENRIIISSQSFNYPLLPNTSEANRSKNRRCDFEVVQPKK